MAKQIQGPVVPILYPDSMGVDLNPSHYVAPQPIMELRELVPDFARWEEWQKWIKWESREVWLKGLKRNAKRHGH